MPQLPPSRRAQQLGIDVELRVISNHGSIFPPHWHDDLQVIASINGAGEAMVDGQTLVVPQGALVVIPPGAVHTAWAKPGSTWTFQSLHALPQNDLGASETWQPVVAHGGSDLRIAFSKAIKALFGSDEPAVRRAFDRFMRTAGTQMASGASMRSPLPACLRGATTALGSLLPPLPTIEDIARTNGVSASHFSRIFRAAYGMSPLRWRTFARIEAAKRVLRQGGSIADASAIAGMSNAGAFSRLYRQYTGVTARAYLSSIKKNKSR